MRGTDPTKSRWVCLKFKKFSLRFFIELYSILNLIYMVHRVLYV